MTGYYLPNKNEKPVDEKIGDTMPVLTPGEVREKYGPLFSERFLVMVDEERGKAEIIETCRHQGTIEWDVMNRKRAGGAIESAIVEGSTLTMLTALGFHPARFGPAEDKIGGQALESVTISGDEVTTGWAGIAGAGVGIAACLPQAPGVIRTEYPTEEDLTPGGARICRTRIVSPRYEKITFGIDDTDTKEGGATWVLALKCAEQCKIEGTVFIRMRLVQLNPNVPNKTTNCVGAVLVFAATHAAVPKLKQYVADFIEKNAISGESGIAFRSGIYSEDSKVNYLKRVKTEILLIDEAEKEAKVNNVSFIDSTGGKGRIGALGALLWEPCGVNAAGLFGEHL